MPINACGKYLEIIGFDNHQNFIHISTNGRRFSSQKQDFSKNIRQFGSTYNFICVSCRIFQSKPSFNSQSSNPPLPSDLKRTVCYFFAISLWDGRQSIMFFSEISVDMYSHQLKTRNRLICLSIFIKRLTDHLSYSIVYESR